MKMNNIDCEVVSFDFTFDNIAEELSAESSYIASSFFAMAAEKQSVQSLVMTEDENTFARNALRKAYVAISARLMAYLSPLSMMDYEECKIRLVLPSGRREDIDALIRHELQRALVTYVLARWYEYRSPEVAARQMALYEAAVSMVMHDIFMAYGGMKRGTSYF